MGWLKRTRLNLLPASKIDIIKLRNQLNGQEDLLKEQLALLNEQLGLLNEQYAKLSITSNGPDPLESTPLIMIKNLINRIRPVKTNFELIRLGSDNDGGYLVPRDLERISACFSPGVDVNASFEIDLLNKFNINSHLADFSVDSAPLGCNPLSFTKKFIGSDSDETHITLNDWVTSKEEDDLSDDLILQMDIEGSEYEALSVANEKILRRFRIMVIEFHNGSLWGNLNFFSNVESIFNKILNDFVVVHIHPNNCCGIVNVNGFPIPRVFEITFLRKDRVLTSDFEICFPNPLDRPNLRNKKDLILPRVWYS